MKAGEEKINACRNATRAPCLGQPEDPLLDVIPPSKDEEGDFA